MSEAGEVVAVAAMEKVGRFTERKEKRVFQLIWGEDLNPSESDIEGA